MRYFLLLLAIGALCRPSNAQHDPHAHMRVNSLYRLGPTQAALQEEAFHPPRQALQGVVVPKPTTIHKTFRFDWKTLSPDGGPARPMITINGQYPGPTIMGNAGDRLVVKVINNLDVPSSIHWHGFYQNGTNNMDGIPGVTQYAIMPGQTFVYNFTLDIPGSYWYHSHYRTQYVDGLKGVIIVRDPAMNDHMYANNVIDVSDLYWNSSVVLTKQFLDPSNTEGEEPVPPSALINGVGQINCGGKGQTKCKYAKITMGYSEPCDCTNYEKCRKRGGVTRIVNTAGFATIDVLIDEHLMWLVAADTVPIVPTAPVGSIRLNTGQRYDVVVCRNISRKHDGWTKPAWIRARMDQQTFGHPTDHPNVLGVLTYKDQCQWRPQTTAWSQKQIVKINAEAKVGGNDASVIDPYKLQPLPGFPKPPPATVTIKLEIGIYADPKFNNSVRAHFNGISQIDLADITTPLLDLAQCKQPYPKNENGGQNIITINYNDVVDVIINNHDEGEHPIHLHGQNFWIMSRGMGDFEKFDDCITHTARDTATVEASGHLAFRFTARNRGIWLMHCHIDWHMAAGLGLIWSVGLGQ